jgi:hypothetical protein
VGCGLKGGEGEARGLSGLTQRQWEGYELILAEGIF